jgi:tetratricopeptide (TPR) repeat protein
VWTDKREYDKAIKDFDEAITLDPKYAHAYYNRGVAWYSKGEYDKANCDFTEAMTLDPKYANAFYNRGLTWWVKGEYNKAIADFDNAITLDPKDALTYYNRAKVCTKMKKYDEAVRGFEKALELNPTCKILCAFAGFRASCPEVKYRDGKKAVELAKKAIETAGAGANWEHSDTLAMACAEAGDFEQAVAEQRKAIEMLKGEKDYDKDDLKQAEARLELYKAKKPYRGEE